MIFGAARNLLPEGEVCLEQQHDRSHDRALRQGDRFQNEPDSSAGLMICH